MIVSGLGQCSYDYLGLVESYPAVDTKNEVVEWHEQAGGPVATALVTLSRLGAATRFSGVTGDDDTGKKIRQSLVDEAVDVTGLIERNNSFSQTAFIVIEKTTARRTIFWKRPSGHELSPHELPKGFPEGSDFLLLDGLMTKSSLYAAGKARDKGIPVMLDAGRARPGMIEVAQSSDYLVASSDFARDLGWNLIPDVLKKEREKLGVKVLTVTTGERGSITVCPDGVLDIQAFNVDAVDTTGAGDVFHGAYIYGILSRWRLTDILLFASAAAAMKCTRIGGRTGIPRMNEALYFLKERGIILAPEISENKA